MWKKLSIQLFTGIGIACMEIPQVVVLSSYFHKKKELADSIRVSGNPLGGVFLPLIFVSLVETFGLKLSFIILSGGCLQVLVFVALIQTYKKRQIIVHRSSLRQSRKMSVGREVIAKTNDVKAETIEIKSKRFDSSLLRERVYLMYVGMIVFWSVAYPHTSYFSVTYGKTISISPRINSYVMVYMSMLDFVSRIIIGFCLHRHMFTKETVFVTW